MLKRVFLFIAMNIAIMLTVSISLFVISAVFGVNLTGYNTDIVSLALYSGVIGFSGAFISLALSRWMAKKSYGIEPIDPESLHTYDSESQAVYRSVERLSRAANIPMPEVGIYESSEANAFATGPSKSKSLVAVSRGLLETMTRDEIDGVIAHEVAHIANGDMVTMTLLQGVLNTMVVFLSRIIANFADSYFRSSDDESSGPSWIYFVVSIVLDILLGFLAHFVLMAFSRHREYRADAGSAQIGSTSNMIAALKKLQTLSHNPHTAATEKDPQVSMKISGGESWSEWFMSHPPLEKRIAALQNRSL